MTATLTIPQLATPPKPPIPALERPLSPEALEQALRSFHGSYYVEHPFHKLMYEGKLSQRQFQGWVANRLAYQRVVPRKDAAILSNCPDATVRREWIQRIIDHDGIEPGTGGIELWIRLGVALGVPREEMEDERHVLPAVRFICESYVTFCRTKTWQEAVASSLTELFAPKIHQQRIESFPRHYPWIPPEALDYFKSRLVQAPRDVNHGLRIVKEWATTPERQRKVFEALAFKLEMLWAMIDTIHNAYREERR
ncbi:MAG TPA: pyrroloquinoline-quinone synthase PqqC [Gemmatimonadales bacterium]|jgi:pyrroloquinoline-quinone synthase|nr:pyrroloquinoline-quinone synthase PqqC [Gemmatimonadales bacterium]